MARGKRWLKPRHRKWLRQRRNRLRRRYNKLRKRLRTEKLYTYRFYIDPDHTPPTVGIFTLREADVDSLAALREHYPEELSEHKLALLQSRVGSATEKCWLVSDDDGALVGYGHVSLESTLNARINHFVKVAPHQAYFFDDYVFKAHRGRGVHGFMIAERVRALADLGVTEALLTVSRKNTPSIASFSKFGIEQELSLLFVPSLGRTLRWPTLGYLRRRVRRRAR